MRHVTITGPVTKQCPYKHEPDDGTVTLTFHVNGDAPELHALAAHLKTFTDIATSHEDFTEAILDQYAQLGCVKVSTTWRTAGLNVTVTADGAA